jgi:hypothetical protein
MNQEVNARLAEYHGMWAQSGQPSTITWDQAVRH